MFEDSLAIQPKKCQEIYKRSTELSVFVVNNKKIIIIISNHPI